MDKDKQTVKTIKSLIKRHLKTVESSKDLKDLLAIHSILLRRWDKEFYNELNKQLHETLNK